MLRPEIHSPNLHRKVLGAMLLSTCCAFIFFSSGYLAWIVHYSAVWAGEERADLRISILFIFWAIFWTAATVWYLSLQHLRPHTQWRLAVSLVFIMVSTFNLLGGTWLAVLAKPFAYSMDLIAFLIALLPAVAFAMLLTELRNFWMNELPEEDEHA